jgi:hypothetical protein
VLCCQLNRSNCGRNRSEEGSCGGIGVQLGLAAVILGAFFAHGEHVDAQLPYGRYFRRRCFASMAKPIGNATRVRVEGSGTGILLRSNTQLPVAP